MVSPETYVVINIPRVGPDTSAIANVVIRGVSQRAFQVRKNITLTGRTFASGQSEVCVGEKLVPRFLHTAIGEKLRFAGREWTVVCHFSASGSSFESEVWGEAEQFQSVMRGNNTYQSVTFRLKDPQVSRRQSARCRATGACRWTLTRSPSTTPTSPSCWAQCSGFWPS